MKKFLYAILLIAAATSCSTTTRLSQYPKMYEAGHHSCDATYKQHS